MLGGYDLTGVLLDPPEGPALREHLLATNQRVPGTAGIHLVFREAPLVIGFGTAYTSISCTVLDPQALVVLYAQLEPPSRRSVRDLLLPMEQAESRGRRWGSQTWRGNLASLFPARNSF